MNRMSLAMLAPANSVHTHRWANSLSEFMDVTLFSLETHPAQEGDLKKEVRIHYLPSKGKSSYFIAPQALKKLCKERCFDVYNVHYASGYGTLMRLARICPAVMNFWGSDIYEFPYRSKLHRWMLGRNISHAEKIVSTSQAMKKEIEKLYGKKAREIAVIPFGVNLNNFSFKQRVINSNVLKMGTCKILDSIYGIDHMVSSFETVLPSLEKMGIDAELHLYGDGPQRSLLEKLVEEKKLGQKVTFHGWVAHREIPSILKDLDIFLLSSLRESFGVSAIEAMATGLPVIATKTEGFSEVIEDGKSGILVEIADVDEMAKAILDLCTNKEKYYEISKQARIRVEDQYDWSENVKTMVDLLSRYKYLK